jgi:hypothetical protein
LRSDVQIAGPVPLYGWFARTLMPAPRSSNISRSAISASYACDVS